MVLLSQKEQQRKHMMEKKIVIKQKIPTLFPLVHEIF